MAFTALSILTHGWHHPGKVDLVVDESPTIVSVVEVRPTIKATVAPPTVGPAGKPVITGARNLTPRIVDMEGPQQQTGADEPGIVSAENLVPRITKAEED